MMLTLIDNDFRPNADGKSSHVRVCSSAIHQSYQKLVAGNHALNLQIHNIHDVDKILVNICQKLNDSLHQVKSVLCVPLGLNLKSPLIAKALEKLVQNDVLIIAPSGNKGPDTVLSPGIYTETLCVGAADKDGCPASFSGRLYDEEDNCIKPEVLAPGVDVDIPLEGGGLHRASGTSIACATVAGLAAALFDANPEATSNDVKMAIYESCTLAEGSRYGLINPEKALENIRTKVPYDAEPDLIDPPAFMKETYIDYRLRSQCKRAVQSDDKVEALITADDTKALMTRLDQGSSMQYSMFKNFDMAHVQAQPAFYETLFEQPDLQVASAVDINYFDL